MLASDSLQDLGTCPRVPVDCMDLIQIRKIYRIGNGMGKYPDLCNPCQSLLLPLLELLDDLLHVACLTSVKIGTTASGEANVSESELKRLLTFRTDDRRLNSGNLSCVCFFFSWAQQVT